VLFTDNDKQAKKDENKNGNFQNVFRGILAYLLRFNENLTTK
jgi:hypothetical protein